MPLYSYKCETCGVFEVMRPMKDYDQPISCPTCSVPTSEQVITGCSVRFGKGSDTYERRVMQERYNIRNKKLDALPPEQKKQMAKFMSDHGVRKDAPMNMPPKTQKKGPSDG